MEKSRLIALIAIVLILVGAWIFNPYPQSNQSEPIETPKIMAKQNKDESSANQTNFQTVTNHHAQNFMKELNPLMPSKAEKIPHVLDINGQQLTDNYFWLRDKNWPKVADPKILKFLNAENAYAQAFFKQHQTEFDKLYQEITGRIKLEDRSVPIKKDQYYYYSRTEKDSNHTIYCRKEGSEQANEEIILDANALAKDHSYFSLGTWEVTHDHQKLLYSADITGGDRYTVKVKDLKNNQLLPDTVENTFGAVIWNKAGTGFFYAKLSDHWRTEEIYFHKLGDNQAQDTLLYKERDPLFMVSLDQSNSERFLFITAESKDTSEIRYIDLDLKQDKPEPVLIQARHEEHLYHVDHHGDLFYILTNDKGKNFRLVTTPIQNPSQASWQEMIAHNPKIYLNEFSLYKNHLALSSKEGGLTKIQIIDLNTKAKDDIQFPDPTYEASQIFTTFGDKGLRISYSSLIAPSSVLLYDFNDKKLATLKVQEIPSGYDKSLYQSERIFATSKDGTQIPISLVYKKSLFKQDGNNPLYLYGYGSYGSAVPASFRHYVLSLLDRGFVYAIAHVRGGDEMGYDWYESAKFLTKRNTFDDFIASADFLVNKHYTTAGNITISGASAGGMLIGVCVNERPELFKMAIADVPFVDVLNTMLDDSLPLTPGEFKEWGNPKDPKYFQYIKSYSPYDNVKSQSYPPLFVSAGINDPRVTYWEPAKWVAKLREMKTDNNLLLLDTNMDAGHAGASGRFGRAKEIAKEYLFIFTIQGT